MKPDKIRTLRRRITLVALLIAGAALVYFFVSYGSWRVIPGMDTMEGDIPQGATCIIQKNPSRVSEGSVVVLELEGGGVLLTRVLRLDGDKIFIRHDNRSSRFRGYEERSYAMTDVRALVLTTLKPDPAPDLVPETDSRGK